MPRGGERPLLQKMPEGIGCGRLALVKRFNTAPVKPGGAARSKEFIFMEAVPRKTTIREVARAASVGVGTISRVLNSSSQVSRETRERVLKAIRRLGFRPNAQARRILKRRA